MMVTENEYRLWLANLPHISSAKIALLTEKFGSAENIYKAQKADIYGIEKIGSRETEALCDKSMDRAHRVMEQLDKAGAYTLCVEDKDYPEMLRHCYEPPYMLYALGEKTSWENMLCISVVGSRKCSDYGIGAANKICTELAESGVVIVSGMARGIDSAAHRSALRAGAKTVAFLGCGIDIVYPPENDGLMRAIAENGMVITEFAPQTPPYARNFPVRNRLIAAFSRGVFVVEAAETSGTMTTANWAIENGKDVFALPGDYNRSGSAGCNALIRSGCAKLVCSAKDILEEYVYELENLDMGSRGRAEPVYVGEPERHMPQNGRAVQSDKKDIAGNDNKKDIDINDAHYDVLDDKQKEIILFLADKDRHADEICRHVGLSASEAAAALTLMELQGFVEALAGKMFTLCRR